jgi:hypothetical protein
MLVPALTFYYNNNQSARGSVFAFCGFANAPPSHNVKARERALFPGGFHD